MVEPRWEKFQTLLQRVRESNAFQADHFPALADCAQWAGFDDFAENCPFTEKNDLALDRRENKPYGTNLTFPVEEYSCFHQTSGTMGEPMAWLDTQEDWNWMLGNWDRVLEGAGVQSGAVVFLPFRLARFLVFGRPTMPLGNGAAFAFPGRAGERTAPAFDSRARGRIFVLYTDLCLEVAGSGQASRYRLERARLAIDHRGRRNRRQRSVLPKKGFRSLGQGAKRV